MKVKTLVRNPDHYLRETKRDIFKVPRNYDPSLHPFQGPREYTRALNATKLDRVFAKPFVGNLKGHTEGVSALGKHPSRLSVIVSGAYNGEVRIWDLSQQTCLHHLQAHESYVRGLTFDISGEHFISVGDDKTIKTWDVENCGTSKHPANVIISKSVLLGITHHRTENKFATCGEVCQLWDETRNEPIRIFEWNVDSLHNIAFNQIETHVLASCASDRSIILYDSRETGPVRKLVMKLRSNQVVWNPMEAYILSVANEDYNIYSYDTRKFNAPIMIHKDNVGAVTCLDYAPTGKEIVSGSYDRSIRIFPVHKGHSRDVYHTKRMQHVLSVSWSLDNKYICSASDEMNIRIWKARASEKLGVLKPRERDALHYNEMLKSKFAGHPQIRRIARHRQIPKYMFNARNQLREAKEKIKRKEANVRKHSKKGTIPHVPERKKHVVEVQE
ncbi:unnamed protein product [Bemisia tabaci]|uniref:DDB1- and CUL4-associated factor 13 n=1 Tax=Bemisia tabaci TaxID=7038 RepID=A0A9P0ALM1_BEMTA|nr:PREDICTED: DDB1- and CUL4-associated factor 13 [Bemisia tabaci]CAH0393326.1 unnamed protein product [Bemisia tabaci]